MPVLLQLRFSQSLASGSLLNSTQNCNASSRSSSATERLIRRPRRIVCAPLVLLSALIVPHSLFAAEAPTSGTEDKSSPVMNPIVLLIRDPGIQQELQLRSAQKQKLEQLLDDWNERLFALRVASDVQQVADVLSQFEAELQKLLTSKQWKRLEGFRIQAQGWQALRRKEIAKRLQLTSSQQKQIEEILPSTQKKLQELQKEAAKKEKTARNSQKQRKLERTRHKRITALLTERQKRIWLDLVGPQYDFSQMIRIAAEAPELRGVAQWINSPPLKLPDLRGKVVVLHFFAANCINCIRNFPHYRKWHEKFDDSEVVILGIHTPETQAERNIDNVRKKIEQEDLRFPIAIDQAKQNWNAWTNRMWPSVYLIDKQGRVRYWWYGELQWKENEGEQWMRNRIQELIAEESDNFTTS